MKSLTEEEDLLWMSNKLSDLQTWEGENRSREEEDAGALFSYSPTQRLPRLVVTLSNLERGFFFWSFTFDNVLWKLFRPGQFLSGPVLSVRAGPAWKCTNFNDPGVIEWKNETKTVMIHREKIVISCHLFFCKRKLKKHALSDFFSKKAIFWNNPDIFLDFSTVILNPDIF